MYFRVTDGELNVGDRVMLMNTRKEHVIDELGVLAPKPVNVSPFSAGPESFPCLSCSFIDQGNRWLAMQAPVPILQKCMPDTHFALPNWAVMQLVRQLISEMINQWKSWCGASVLAPRLLQ